jgi:hypothetical protein
MEFGPGQGAMGAMQQEWKPAAAQGVAGNRNMLLHRSGAQLKQKRYSAMR